MWSLAISVCFIVRGSLPLKVQVKHENRIRPYILESNKIHIQKLNVCIFIYVCIYLFIYLGLYKYILCTN
jgi:hypothetical protein